MNKLPWSYIVNWVISVVLAFTPLLFTSDKKQFFELLIPFGVIVWLVIADHIASYLQQEKLRDELKQACTLAITDTQVTEFQTQAAHEYVAANAPRAARIFNTRLARREAEVASRAYMDAKSRQDAGFKRAIRGGTEYNLIYDTTHSQDVEEFNADVSNVRSRIGFIHSHAIDTHGVPLIQFIVLEYHEGYSECLLGYGLGDEIATAEHIYLIRSQPLCSYFKHVHNMYRHLMALPRPAQVLPATT